MLKKELIQALHALIQDVSLETALFQEKVATRAGLSVNDMRALSLIMKHDGLTATDLSKKLHVTNGAVTGILNRLALKQLILKQPSEHDARKLLVHANYDKIMKDNSDYQGIGDAYQDLLNSYSVEELRLILQYTERTLRLTAQQRALLDIAE